MKELIDTERKDYSARRFLSIWVVVVVAVCALAGSVAWVAKMSAMVVSGDTALYHYQVYKIDNVLEEGSTIFLGDSGAGHAIDASLWQKISGKPAINLALHGTAGFRGNYLLLQRILRKATPDKVVIMATINNFTRGQEKALGLRDVLQWQDEAGEDWWQKLKYSWHTRLNLPVLWLSVQHIWRVITTKEVFTPYGAYIRGDYISQNLPENDLNAEQALLLSQKRIAGYGGKGRGLHLLTVKDVRQSKFEYLEKISDLCKEKNIRCIFSFAPTLEWRCEHSSAFIEQVRLLLQQRTDMPVVEHAPLCVSPEKMGDMEFHIHPNYKQQVTKQYYDILNKYLN